MHAYNLVTNSSGTQGKTSAEKLKYILSLVGVCSNCLSNQRDRAESAQDISMQVRWKYLHYTGDASIGYPMISCWPAGRFMHVASRSRSSRQLSRSKDGNGSDSNGIEFGYHFLPHFKSNTDTDSDILGYEYKTDVSDSDSNSDINLIYELTFSYFLY